MRTLFLILTLVVAFATVGYSQSQPWDAYQFEGDTLNIDTGTDTIQMWVEMVPVLGHPFSTYQVTTNGDLRYTDPNYEYLVDWLMFQHTYGQVQVIMYSLMCSDMNVDKCCYCNNNILEVDNPRFGKQW